jgi:hypothetical protein
VTERARPRAELVCRTDAIEASERLARSARIERLFRDAALARQAVSGGYAFRFAAHEIEEIARFVALERRCCPFLEFSIDVPAEDGPVWLVVTGPRGSEAVIEAELLR